MALRQCAQRIMRTEVGHAWSRARGEARADLLPCVQDGIQLAAWYVLPALKACLLSLRISHGGWQHMLLHPALPGHSATIWMAR